jgi:hypothetical protein
VILNRPDSVEPLEPQEREELEWLRDKQAEAIRLISLAACELISLGQVESALARKLVNYVRECGHAGTRTGTRRVD